MPQSPPQVPVSSSPAKVDDAVLLRKIADGDVAALGILFDQTARPLYSLVMQLLRSHDAAEDIVESTFWQVWQDASVLSENPDPRSWLLGAGRRRALEHLRSRRRQREELLADKRQFGDLVSTSAARESNAGQEFARSLYDLNPEDRQALELGYFRGLNQTDIADLIGESTATVKARMRSALSSLRTDETEESSAE